MTSPHIGIGVLAGSTGGPATYGHRLIRSLAELNEFRLTVLTDNPSRFEGIDCEIVDLPMRGGLDRLRWQHLALPRALRSLGCDLFHDTKNALPFRLEIPAVVTVHDLAYYRVPESFGLWSRMFLKRATRDAVKRAQRVIVPSQATANDVLAIYPNHAEKTRVVLHGIDPHAKCTAEQLHLVKAKYALDGPFVLHVGTVQSRKNIDLVVRATRSLRANGLPHRLIVVGRRGWLSEPTFREIDKDDSAEWLGAVPGEDLPALYELADAFVSPSSYEGFGFTVADALAAGTPTVISAISSLPEVCGDAAIRIDSLSADAIATAMRPLLEDQAERDTYRTQGQARAKEFSWRRAAEGTAAVYREALPEH